MGDFKSPGLIGRTFFNDGGGLTVQNAWRWTYCSERLAVDRARPANVRAPFSIRSS